MSRTSLISCERASPLRILTCRRSSSRARTLAQRRPTSTQFKSNSLPKDQENERQHGVADQPAAPNENLMRGVHFLNEYAEAEQRLNAWGIVSTVVVFGSARIGGAVASTPGQ